MLYIKIAIILLVTLISAITDLKTGYIFDYITYPFIGIGFIFAILSHTFIQSIILSLIIFIFGYLLYLKGGIGGGDIKLLSGIPLYIPYYNHLPFILLVILSASIFAIVIYGIYYIIYLFMKHPKNFYLTIGLVFIISLFLSTFFINNGAWFFSIFFMLDIMIIFFLYKDYITENLYKKEIDIKDLLEDDLADLTFLNKGKMQPLDEKLFKDVKKTNIKKIVVYRNLPVFGPFIFLGVVFSTYLLIANIPLII